MNIWFWVGIAIASVFVLIAVVSIICIQVNAAKRRNEAIRRLKERGFENINRYL